MANGIVITIEGLDALMTAFDDLDARIMRAADLFVFKVVSHAAERATQNAPILTGALRAAMLGVVENTPVTQGPPPALRMPVVTGYVTDTMEYAFKMHELFYNLGPVSVVQPPTPEGGVGRKYIERVIQFHLHTYEQALGDTITKLLPPGATGISASITTS